MVKMPKEGFTRILNFMTPGALVLVLGHDHLGHVMKMPYFIKITRLSS